MEKEKSRSKLLAFIRIFLGIGIILFAIYLWKFYKAEYEVKGSIRLLGLISYLAISIPVYMFLVIKRKVILSNLFLLVILLLSVEVWCFFKLNQPSYYKKVFPPPGADKEHISNKLGTVLYADSVYDINMDKNGHAIDVKYSIDKFCKRVTPDYSEARKKYALFFGCSVAFGENLNDNQTMAYYLQEHSGEYNSYNFGLGGKSTNNMLAWLQWKPLSEQVKEKDGVAYYIFFWDHIYRAIGTMNRHTSWTAYEPYYYMKDGKVVRDRLFIDGRNYISKFYQWVYQSNIVKYFKLDFPLALNKSHLELIAEMIKQSEREYQRQFGNDNFYCVIFPEYYNAQPKFYDDFKNMLKEKNIKTIDLSKIFNYGPGESQGLDSHPSAKTNDSLSVILLNETKKFN